VPVVGAPPTSGTAAKTVITNANDTATAVLFIFPPFVPRVSMTRSLGWIVFMTLKISCFKMRGGLVRFDD
jgi:hypothetical protein